jgi:hypothetical protein
VPTSVDSITKNNNSIIPIIKPITTDPQLMPNLFDSKLEYYRKKEYNI